MIQIEALEKQAEITSQERYINLEESKLEWKEVDRVKEERNWYHTWMKELELENDTMRS